MQAYDLLRAAAPTLENPRVPALVPVPAQADDILSHPISMANYPPLQRNGKEITVVQDRNTVREGVAAAGVDQMRQAMDATLGIQARAQMATIKSGLTAAALQFAKQRMHTHVDRHAATAMEDAMVAAGNLVARDQAMGKLRTFEQAAVDEGEGIGGASGDGGGYTTPHQPKRGAPDFTQGQGQGAAKRPSSRNENEGGGSGSGL